MRSAKEVSQAESYVCDEWRRLAELAAELSQIQGHRTLRETAMLEAFMLHERCLINFLCGGYRGGRNKGDITPEDFLGFEWHLQDEQLDRKLRGRLLAINRYLAHLSWSRVHDEEALIWSASFMAAELSWAMHQFVLELRRTGASSAASFQAEAEAVAGLLPEVDPRQGETEVPLAPRR